jgi:MSHA pilin protein MshC
VPYLIRTGKVKLSWDKLISGGFTLIELVMTIVILGILSATALPKFFNFSTYQQRGFFDDTLNAIRYAQKLAVVTGCNVQVSISANTFTINRPGAVDRSLCASTTAADYTLAVSRPGSNESTYQGSLAGVTLTSATVYFTSKGTASSDVSITVGSQQINIIKDTGFVYAP